MVAYDGSELDDLADAELPRELDDDELVDDNPAAMRRARQYDATRRLLDALEAEGIEPPSPFWLPAIQAGWSHNEGLRGRSGLARILRIARSIGLVVRKEPPTENDQRNYLLFHPGGEQNILNQFGKVYGPAALTCRRVQVGTRTVEKPIMVQQGTETVEEPVYEWRCESPVLADDPVVDAEDRGRLANPDAYDDEPERLSERIMREVAEAEAGQ
jgi:hypothetical protein